VRPSWVARGVLDMQAPERLKRLRLLWFKLRSSVSGGLAGLRLRGLLPFLVREPGPQDGKLKGVLKVSSGRPGSPPPETANHGGGEYVGPRSVNVTSGNSGLRAVPR